MYILGALINSNTLFFVECGLTSSEPNVRIVGGKYSVEHSWPYSVVVVIKYTTIKKLHGDNLKIKISFL